MLSNENLLLEIEKNVRTIETHRFRIEKLTNTKWIIYDKNNTEYLFWNGISGRVKSFDSLNQAFTSLVKHLENEQIKMESLYNL